MILLHDSHVIKYYSYKSPYHLIIRIRRLKKIKDCLDKHRLTGYYNEIDLLLCKYSRSLTREKLSIKKSRTILENIINQCNSLLKSLESNEADNDIDKKRNKLISSLYKDSFTSTKLGLELDNYLTILKSIENHSNNPKYIKQLKKVAHKLINEKSSKGRHKDFAFIRFVNRLADCYEKSSEKKATITTIDRDNSYGGKFYELIFDLLNILDQGHRKNQTLGKLLKEILKFRTREK